MRIVRISSIEQVSEQIPWALSVVRLIRVGRTWLTRIQWVESGTGYTLMGRLIWPDFCSALIVGRLAPLGLHNTRFRSVPVSCSPRTGADASSSTTRPTGTSPIPGPSNPGRACVARRARSCTRRRRSRPWRCRTSRRPCRPREACRTPRPWWCTRGRCTARHGRNGARDRPCRHARRPMISPVPAPAAAALCFVKLK